jgi:hypothetical protein
LEDRVTKLELEKTKLIAKIEILEREKKSADKKYDSLKSESEKKISELRTEKDSLEDR